MCTTSTPTTLSPRLILSSPAESWNPKVLSVPVSWIVWSLSRWRVTLSVVTLRIGGRPPLLWILLRTLCLSNSVSVTCSSTTSRPVHVCSAEFQKLADIPPFSRSSTPRRSAIPLNTESTLTMSGVGRTTSSIQKSEAGFSSIAPAKSAMWNGLRFSVLVARGCSTKVTSSNARVKPVPFLVTLLSAKSSAQR